MKPHDKLIDIIAELQELMKDPMYVFSGAESCIHMLQREVGWLEREEPDMGCLIEWEEGGEHER